MFLLILDSMISLDPQNLPPCITIDSNICSGKPTLTGTRISISQILATLGEGTSIRDFVNDFELDKVHLERLTELMDWLALQFETK